MKTKYTPPAGKEPGDSKEVTPEFENIRLSKSLEAAIQEIRDRDGQTFSEKWRGTMVPRSDADDPKLEYLLQEYGDLPSPRDNE